MAKGNKKNTEVTETVEVNEVTETVENTDKVKDPKPKVEKSNLNEKERFEIILLASSKLVKVDTTKKVSGNVANVLINKGFAKLKN